MAHLYRSLLRLLPCLLVVLFAFPPADLSAREYFKWKKKGGKMALEYRPLKGKKTVVTDYIFDADFPDSYGYDGKRVGEIFGQYSTINDEAQMDPALTAIVVRTNEGVGLINGLGDVIVPYGKYDKIDNRNIWGWVLLGALSEEYRVYKEGKGYGLLKISEEKSGKRRRMVVKETLAPAYSSMIPADFLYYSDLGKVYIDESVTDFSTREYDDDKCNLEYLIVGKEDEGGKTRFGLILRDVGEVIAPEYDAESFEPYKDVYRRDEKRAVRAIRTIYNSPLYAVKKDGKQCLVLAGNSVLFEGDDSVPWSVDGVIPYFSVENDGLMVRSRKRSLNMSRPVGYVDAKSMRVRPLPDELYDLYLQHDSTVRSSRQRVFPAKLADMKAFSDKSGWIACVSESGDSLVGYTLPDDEPRLVLLNSTAQLRDSGKVVTRDGAREVYQMDNRVGLRHRNSDFILPPVYYSVEPIAGTDYTLVSTMPLNNSQRLWGLVSKEGVITPAQFDRVITDSDGKIRLSRSLWPDYCGVYDIVPRRGKVSVPFKFTFDPSTGKGEYNFDDLLNQYDPSLSDDRALKLFIDLESLGAAIDLNEFRALNYEAYALWLASSEENIGKASTYIRKARGLSDAQRFTDSFYLIAEQRRAFDRERIAREEIRRAREAEEAAAARAQAAVQRQNRAQAWADLASALGQLAGDINNVVGQYAASKSRNSNSSRSSSAGSYSSSSSQSGSSSEYIPVTVLEVWVPHAGQKAEPTYEKRSMYKRFYGNRWCLFPHKGSSNFHVAAPNNDRKCEHADVSGYKYKAIDPKVIGGKWYYYFD